MSARSRRRGRSSGFDRESRPSNLTACPPKPSLIRPATGRQAVPTPKSLASVTLVAPNGVGQRRGDAPYFREQISLRRVDGGQIFNGDALTFLRAVRDAVADVVFLDPPFNLGKLYG